MGDLGWDWGWGREEDGERGRERDRDLVLSPLNVFLVFPEFKVLFIYLFN